MHFLSFCKAYESLRSTHGFTDKDPVDIMNDSNQNNVAIYITKCFAFRKKTLSPAWRVYLLLISFLSGRLCTLKNSRVHFLLILFSRLKSLTEASRNKISFGANFSMTGNPIFGPKLAPKPLKLPKIRISRTENRRKLCDPSKEPQCTNYMGCSKTCTPIKWPEVLEK